MLAPTARANQPHPPLAGQHCAGCHQPHSGEHFRLLKDDYPKEFYAPFKAENFSLCFKRRDAGLPHTKRTAALLDFLCGNKDLHVVLVNKTQKGRTFRTCHESYANIAPNHIRNAVPFGKWSLPIHFTQSENGGTCPPGCHAQLNYERKKTSQAAAR
ncbi:MAG: hypothetical protein HY821_08460 [Acidobacteria bacterium]|nr:hypothetical protein [Acidobacteriota bacterium]